MKYWNYYTSSLVIFVVPTHLFPYYLYIIHLTKEDEEQLVYFILFFIYILVVQVRI
jgi:hypothetical protein